MTTMTKTQLDAYINAAVEKRLQEYAAAAAASAPAKQSKKAKQGKKAKQPEKWLLPEKRENDKYNGIELVFSGKPVEPIRTFIKGNGFHWNGTDAWYVKRSDANQEIAAYVVYKIEQALQLPEGERDEFLNGNTVAAPAPVAAPAAPAAAPVVNRIPKDAPKAQAADGPLAVGQCFILDRDFPGFEKVYKIVSFPADDKVKVKYDDGKTAVHKLQKTEYGTYYITVNKRRAPLVG